MVNKNQSNTKLALDRSHPTRLRLTALIAALACSALACQNSAQADNWTLWRGPAQNGYAPEDAVVTSWSQDGENLQWHVPYGGRTTPILIDNRVCAIMPAGSGESLGERVICLDRNTGKTIWEHRFNVFHTDIVEVRLGWTSLAGDPATGNLYAHGTGGEFFCFDRNGKILWKQSLGEEFGRYSGYGGRLHTPIVDEDQVIISYVYILSNWNTGKAKSGHRYVSFDKNTGEVLWWSQPGGKPYDTTYSTPIVKVIDGKRMLIAGNADGCIYAMHARTGERIWKFSLSKRGINTSVVSDGNYVYATHSEENADGSTRMGRVVCIDATKTGDITETGEVWRLDGETVGYASPALANGRLYVVTNSANMICLDAKTGKEHWRHSLGRVMKASPVVTADGVIYVGEVNGQFHILKDEGDKCVSLDVEEFTHPKGLVIEVNGSPAVADGRVYFMTSDDMYCLGKKDAEVVTHKLPPTPPEAKPDPEEPAMLTVVPADTTLNPGASLRFRTRLFDENGREIPADSAQWSVTGLNGDMSADGTLTAGAKTDFAGGEVTAKVGALSATARVRVITSLPIDEDFEDMTDGALPPGWIGVDLKTKLMKKDGQMVFCKLAESPSAPYSRMRAFSGPPIPTGYTVQADLMAEPRPGPRPVLSDIGLINARYKFILLGYEKNVRLVTYSPIPRLQVDVPFDWQPNAWYRAKLRVDLEGDKAIVRGKVWPRDSQEPSDWTIEMTDAAPNREGSPGLYAFSKGAKATKPGSPVYFDNYKVTRND